MKISTVEKSPCDSVDVHELLTYYLFQYFNGVVKKIREAEASLEIPIQVGIGIDITGTGIRVGSLVKVLVLKS